MLHDLSEQYNSLIAAGEDPETAAAAIDACLMDFAEWQEAHGEAARMDADLDALRAGTAQPAVTLSDEELEAMKEEQIGADESRHPYRY